MKQEWMIGVDMGATKINIGLIGRRGVEAKHRFLYDSQGSQEEILRQLVGGIQELMVPEVVGIGIGVPSLVDVAQGIVYDVQNIPSWKKVPLKEHLQAAFGVPVWVNNDANCFAVGEKYFGAGRDRESFLGLTLGSGLGGGVIIRNRLHSGPNCGAGEFGSLPYLDSIAEDYCSGKFFRSNGLDGKTCADRARNGDEECIELFRKYGDHLGHLVCMLIFALDPQAIIFGGSISRDFEFFRNSLWNRVRTFPYERTLKKLELMPSQLEDSAILGAAALYWDAQQPDEPENKLWMQ